MEKTETIRSEAEYDAALARISELMDALSGPQGQITDGNHPHQVELGSLVSQVERYEDEHYPIDPPSPSAAIEFHLDQTGTIPTDPTSLSEKQEKVS